MRIHHDESDIIGTKPARDETEGLGLFDGAARDNAHARVAGRSHAPVAEAERAQALILEQHKARQREWVERGRAAMVHLWHERQRANEAEHRGQAPVYVTGDDLSKFAELAGFVGDKRALAPVFASPRGFWRAIGRLKSTRRNATLIPMWELVQDTAPACQSSGSGTV